ncbi:MAG TPA: mannose-6-phosphate isomerase, class I [Jatrophihabitans sp.]|nr:mannose-6-phosphate isomerase, class I [Jatrophihabitans sp.]
MTLPRIIELDNPIRDYAWGSPTAIPQLLGTEPSGRPVAELWVGAHPDSPSRWAAGPEAPGLDALIGQQPDQLLGPSTVARFGPRLPFLLKLLAADRALSLQAHPTLAQARAGHAAEQATGAQRNYTDPNHKPELAYAISDFQAFCGFRPVPDTLRLLDALAVAGLAPYRQLLAGPDGLRAAFTALLELTGTDRDELLAGVLAGCRRLTSDPDWSATVEAVLLAASDFPGDFGPVLALLLNHVRLAPGEAIFLAAGNLHAYLRGTCVEVLASSDNVLRGGLTPKHVDVAELVRIADFSPLAEPRWQPDRSTDGLVRFRVPVPDFELTVLALSEQPRPLLGTGPYLVLAGEHPVTIEAGTALTVRPWHAVFLAATGPDDPPATLTGAGRVFAVSCVSD